jgi:hypothetical protein
MGLNGKLSRLRIRSIFSHAGKMNQPNDHIAPLVKRLLPHASQTEKMDATENLRAYVAILYRIFRRLESEAKLPGRRDKNTKPAMVYTENKKKI